MKLKALKKILRPFRMFLKKDKILEVNTTKTAEEAARAISFLNHSFAVNANPTVRKERKKIRSKFIFFFLCWILGKFKLFTDR